MNYTELVARVSDICENEFSTPNMDSFIRQAEQKIYNTVQIPAIRKNVTGTMGIGNPYLQIPTDFLYVFSLAVVDSSGEYHYLLNKDVNFIREAYPINNAFYYQRPRHYAIFSDTAFLIGPTPDQAYTTELHYGYYPPSIVDVDNTWLGDEFDSALLNGTLVEAIRFMKGEQDLIKLYTDMYLQAIALLKNLGDGKLRQDTYRSGQVRNPVS